MVRFTDMLRRIEAAAKGRTKAEPDLLEEWIVGLVEKAPAEPEALAGPEGAAGAGAAAAAEQIAAIGGAPAGAGAPAAGGEARGPRGFVSLEGRREERRDDRGERR